MPKRKKTQQSAASYQQVLSSHVPITPVEVTCDDLNVIEQAICETTLAEAYDFISGRMERFRVLHNAEHIVSITNAGGYRLPLHSPQYSESAEAFLIDRQYTEATESDQPRAAALAGYLHPREWPPNAGHGLHRTA